MTAEELRHRVDDDVSAVLERTRQVRRRQGRIDDERHAGLMRDGSQPLDIGDLAGRVTDHLDVDDLGLGADRGGVVGRVGRRHEGRLDAESAQRDVELGDRAAVELRGGDDVVASADEGGERDELGAHAGCRRYRFPDAALE